MRKNPRRWARPDPPDEPPELSLLRQPHPAALGEPSEQPRKDHAGAGDEIALTQHEVGGQVVRGPALEQRGYERPELGEENAQLKPLLRIERGLGHRRTLATPRISNGPNVG